MEITSHDKELKRFDELIAFAQIATPSGIRAFEVIAGGQLHIIEYKNVTYKVWNNGGEVGVETVNSGELPRFFPLTRFDVLLDCGTLYCRLMTLLDGEEIDYQNEDPVELSLADLKGGKR